MTARVELGQEIDWTPVPAPARAPLVGSSVRLEPLDPERHAAALYAATHGPGSDPHLWDYLSYGPFAYLAEFTAWLTEQAAADDPLFFAVIDGRTGEAAGIATYMRIKPGHGVIEIGNIWFGAALQRTPQATEAIYLLARHVFDDLGYRRLEWKCNALNLRSRAAAERFGFTFEGIFRQHMVSKGRNRDTAWYAMLDGEWPPIRSAFQRWLSPDNFDASGRQRASLRDLYASRQIDSRD